MLETFINRPVLSTVISILITLVGIISLVRLPVTQYPDIAPPSVNVTAIYTGANAEVCAKAVAIPLEDAINGTEGMTYMNTVCSNDGTTNIQVFFELGYDPDIAAVNVQNKVATATSSLPNEVTRLGVITQKRMNSMLMFIAFYSDDPSMDETFLYNFVNINVVTELKRVSGVGDATLMGGKDYSMRVWLKPDRMAAYNLSATDIISAINSQNLEAAPGKVGESSFKEPQVLEYILKYKGKLESVGEYENIIIRANPDGTELLLRDVAEIELGTENYNMVSRTNKRPSASVMLYQTPGSNAQEVIENIKNRLAELQQTSFPSGMVYEIPYDISLFLDASIHEVVKTLIEAFILVFIVVFIFLQDFRSTLIPGIAVPVSLIGTFFFLSLFGFSLNLLTLFALVLAIGIVVDDAIVVVEAVHAKMESNPELSAKEATKEAMKEIVGAIISITLVMAAVFIPVTFMTGPVGVFYTQFALTMAMAIVISGVNALTLSPALCALFLKPEHHGNRKGILGKFFNGFNKGFNKTTNGYKSSLSTIMKRKVIAVALLGVALAGIWGINKILPGGFIPIEDQGVFFVNVSGPPGATLERSQAVLEEVQNIAYEMEEVKTVTTLTGYSLLSGAAGSSFGLGVVLLKPWEERPGRAGTVFGVIAKLNARLKKITDAEVLLFPPPSVPGFGTSSGFEVRLQDRTGGELSQLAKVTQDFLIALNQRPEVSYAITTFNPNYPQYEVEIDAENAMKLGITVQDALLNLQTYFGSYYASDFNRFGKLFRVMVQALPQYRAKPEDVLDIYVKNKMGEMVPFSAIASIKKVYGPEQLTRFNLFNSPLVNGAAAPGYSSGDAIAAVQETAQSSLPRGFTYDWSGMTREEILSEGQATFIFIICLLFVYFILSAQYESYILPFAILIPIPTGIFGAFLFLKLLGLEFNIYSQVALIMLIGLLAKNAILIVEFALQRRQDGKSIIQSAIDGAAARLRPILMTSFAFIVGLMPLVLASGAGAAGNNTIGTAAAGGMLIGTLFGVFIIPAMYVIFQSLQEKISGNKIETK
ncbi:efflux RND transporter permease subunit [Limibacter armeniacum]|uniref:efflux RND transporter permease subunit n=1 Tax=Limibacter armeniacum TaxID=466084 RepID=UPI002FE6166C